MSSTFLLYADLTARTVKTKLTGTPFVFPTFTGGEKASLALRFSETKNGSTVESFPNIAGMRASIGRSDAPPTGGTFCLSIDGEKTAPLAFNATPAQIKTAIDATLTGATSLVRLDGASLAITFSDGASRFVTSSDNDLSPVSIIRIRANETSTATEYELTLVQAPIAATNVWNAIVPPAPSVVKIQGGSTDSSGQFAYPTIENLTIPASFRGTYRLVFNDAKTGALSISDGTTQIAAAINNLWKSSGQSVSVTNPQTSVASISFDGKAFNGADQPLLSVEVISAPPGDNTLSFDLNTSGCYEILRSADTIKDLYLEVEADIIPNGESPESASYHQTVTLFRQKVSLQRPINWTGLEAATPINWATPPGATSYIPFNASQVVTGQQYYIATIGDGASDTFTITHNLDTKALHVTLHDNSASGDIYYNGADYRVAFENNNAITIYWLSPHIPATGKVGVVISTALPKSALLEGLTIDAAQVTGLDARLSSLESNVSTLTEILPSISGAGVSTSNLAITIPITPTTEVIGYKGDVKAIPTPHLLTPASKFNREAWRVAINDKMLALGRTLSIDWGIALQLLKGNCGAEYSLVVEAGEYTDTGSPSHLNINWDTTTPIISQKIVLTQEETIHSFGIVISRGYESGSEVITLDQQVYGIRTGHNSVAPTSANFAIRCRLINLETENITSPKGWVNWGLVPSVSPIRVNGTGLEAVIYS